MKPKILLSALILLLSAGITYAQQSLTCRGTVRDRSGQPMPGVAVLIKGTQAGSMTDINGYYVVDVPSAEASNVNAPIATAFESLLTKIT